MSTPTPRVPGAGSEAVETLSFSEMNAVVHEAKAKILALIAERDVLLDTLRVAVEYLEIAEKMRRPDWNGHATPQSVIGRCRAAIAASSHDIRQAGES